MNRKCKAAALVLCLAAIFGSCSPRDAGDTVREVSSVRIEDEAEPSTPGVDAQEDGKESESEAEDTTAGVDPLTERYYDYVTEHNNIALLIGGEGDGFSDDQMAAFVIAELIQNETYDYVAGHTVEEFNAITTKYFGTTIQNFENSRSTVIPETGTITSTGWGGSSVALVLHEILDTGGATTTALFYQISGGMDSGWPAPEVLKLDLLSGNLDRYGSVYLISVTFEERTDKDGEMYFRYHNIDFLGEVEGPYVPYRGE